MKPEPTTPLAAIRAKCIDCSGGQLSVIRFCQIERCALHSFRMGSNPHRKRRKLSDEARAALTARLPSRRAISPEIQGEKRGSNDLADVRGDDLFDETVAA